MIESMRALRSILGLAVAMAAVTPSPTPRPSQQPGEEAPREWKDIPLKKKEIIDDRSFYDARNDSKQPTRTESPHS